MHPFKKKSHMTSEDFKTALRQAGFGVAQGWVVDVSGKCPGFATLPGPWGDHVDARYSLQSCGSPFWLRSTAPRE
jgi:hypothetical protein